MIDGSFSFLGRVYSTERSLFLTVLTPTYIIFIGGIGYRKKIDIGDTTNFGTIALIVALVSGSVTFHGLVHGQN